MMEIKFEYYVLDISNKKINSSFGDSFVASIGKIKDIKIKEEILSDKRNVSVITIINEDNETTALTIFNNSIIKYQNDNIKEIGDYFLHRNLLLEEFIAPNVEVIGDYFLEENEALEEFIAPSLKKIGNAFLYSNLALRKLILESIKEIGNYFLGKNEILEEFTAPNLEKIGSYFLGYNMSLEKLTLESVRTIGDFFMCFNKTLKEFVAPNLKIIEGNYFLCKNEVLEKFISPNLEKIGYPFLYYNKNLGFFVALSLPFSKIKTFPKEFRLMLIKSNIKYLLFKVFNNYKKENIKDNEDIKNVEREEEKQEENETKSVFLNDILRLIEIIKKHQYKGYENDLNLLKELACDYMKVRRKNVCKSEFEVYMSDSTLIERLVKLELSIEVSINNYLYMKDDLQMLDKINLALENIERVRKEG